jgi:ornithine cyclodeaminase
MRSTRSWAKSSRGEAGRTRDDQITIFGTVGLAFQDLPAAWQVYSRARELGLGR